MTFFKRLKAIAMAPLHKSSLARARHSFVQSTLPVISPRRSRRILRREQLFAVVRESLIRGGVLSTSYDFKVLTLDPMGDTFLVLIDLALSAEFMSDEYLLEIERWIQTSAESRHSMTVRSVYWRRRALSDQRGTALKSAVAAQIRREDFRVSQPPFQPSFPPPSQPSFQPPLQPSSKPSLKTAGPSERPGRTLDDAALPVPESHSDFSALSETQFGKP
jgi:hypothetical protein